MIKTTPHEPLSAEQGERETIHCAMWASVVVFGMLALLLHGLAFLSWTEPKMEEIYRNKRIGEELEVLKNEIMVNKYKINDLQQLQRMIIIYEREKENEYENHKHHFWTGKVKKEVIK